MVHPVRGAAVNQQLAESPPRAGDIIQVSYTNASYTLLILDRRLSRVGKTSTNKAVATEEVALVLALVLIHYPDEARPTLSQAPRWLRETSLLRDGNLVRRKT